MNIRLKNNKKNLRILSITSLVFIVGLTLFLTINLVLFFFINIHNRNDLLYVFDESTKIYKNNSPSDSDISELFLSYGISYGIDVSEWQGDIDWNKVALTGISFAMIRCGFREIEGSNIKEDSQFKKNIEGAIKAGLNVGVYFFGTAKNKEEAKEEAEFVRNLIKDYEITYPIVYDIETLDVGRLKHIDYSTITDNVLEFTETIGTYGYETMVYSNKNTLSYKLDTGKFSGKLVWLAHYIHETDYKGEYSMWQYTNNGKVNGIKGPVDLNISYFKYVENIDDIIENPNNIVQEEVVFNEVDEKVKTNKNTIFRNSASLKIPNSLGKIPAGTELKRTGVNNNISRVIYKDRVVYIDSANLVSIP